jgi:predicted dehydrogenase
MEKTNVAVIGLGGIAQLVHLPVLSKLNNVNISAVADINKTRLKTVGQKFGIQKLYSDYKELISDKNIEAIILATPTNTHRDIALDCIAANKALLIEKPIGRNENEAKEILASAKKHKAKVMVGMNLRYRPDAMLLKSLINGGDLGDIFYVRCGWLRKQSSVQKWFLNKNQAGGGVIIDLGILMLDLALWLMDEPKIKSVSVQKFNHNTKDVEDTAMGLIRMENDCVISFEVSWGLHSDWDKFHLASFGTKGTGHLNPLRAYKRIGASHLDYTISNTTNPQNNFKKSYENELKHFIGSVRDDKYIVSSIDDSVNLMKLLDAMYKSAQTKKEVLL